MMESKAAGSGLGRIFAGAAAVLRVNLPAKVPVAGNEDGIAMCRTPMRTIRTGIAHSSIPDTSVRTAVYNFSWPEKP